MSANYVPAVGSGHFGYLSGVHLSGFDAGCEGKSAVLQLWGNPAGDPSLPMTDDSLLATLNSTLDPCTQQPLKSPHTVQNGGLDLSMCPTGGPAGYVSIHDLTLVALDVNDQNVPVVSPASAGTVKSSTSGAINHGAGGVILAFTGADLELLALFGAVILLFGAALALLVRRGRRHAQPSITQGEV